MDVNEKSKITPGPKQPILPGSPSHDKIRSFHQRADPMGVSEVSEKVQHTNGNAAGGVYAHFHEKEVESLFNIIDKDGNGKITRSELTAFFRRSNQKLGAKEIKEYIKQFDANNDGKITLEELKAVFLKR
ncbi:uncharacterized protein DEA37_0005054 [Paragonimus westermani]|uniref:EF-hand domain-containing protein n=1 Tax=Paragonimus westermani TaxID=34504 RepID=A0A5J4NAN8_9TREM|nr:uncharacterized protein DEA37_0005054 [Paragonimus westermani]